MEMIVFDDFNEVKDKKTNILAIDLNQTNNEAWFEAFDAPDYHFIPVDSTAAALRCLLEKNISMILCHVQKILIETLILVERYAKINDIPILFLSEEDHISFR